MVGTAFLPVKASSSSPILSANVSNRVVHASINLNMVQNLTAYESSFTLPQFRGVIQGSNSTDLTGRVQAAIASKDPSAKVANLVLQAITTPWVNSSSIQWFNVSLNFDIKGLQTDQSGSSRVDMSWKSFSIASNLTIGGYEVNNIGAGYFVPVASQLASISQGGPTSPIRFSFLVNGHPLLPRDYPVLVRNIETLNFTTINTPISKWTVAYAPGNLLSWSFRGGLLGTEIVTTITEPSSTTRAFYGLFYRMTAMVTAPVRSTVSGDSITIVFSDTPETLMALAIISASVLGGIAYFSERRLVSRMGIRKQKR